jgi:glycosyltransferase involved in cell wall biosynthesis/GT2 family glycosyltransferase
MVSSEFLGPFRNGSIGTAYTKLAELLSEAGHDVTLLYTNGRFTVSEPIEHWVTHFRERGMRLVPLPDSPVPIWSSSPNLSVSYRVYLWLRDHDRFDVVHFPEYLGPGYYALTAQRQGLILQRAATVVGLHSSAHWVRLANDAFIHEEADLEVDFLERRSAEMADVVWSPSRYMGAWVREHGWNVPDATHYQPPVVPESGRADSDTKAAGPVREVVFFGRQEIRKGIFLFLAAIDHLAQSPAAQRGSSLGITIMGKSTNIGDKEADGIVRDRAQHWPFTLRILPDRDHEEAIAYLQGEGRLAVMPSLIENFPNTVLECLAHGVPFLASRVGGIPEQIAEEDLERVCFEPKPHILAERLLRVLSDGTAPARLAFDPDLNKAAWVRWHEQLSRQVVPSHIAPGGTVNPEPMADPTISVCITHYNRPGYLRQALRSIVDQDRAPMEVIVVDDGSPGEDIGRELEHIEREFDFARRGWRLVRQENRYLGAARNRAAAEASGDYLLFMDDDNVAKPQEIATFTTAARHSSADVITCLMDMFEGSEAPWLHTDQPIYRRLFTGANPALSVLQNTFGDANALCRRAAFREIGGFTEDYGVTHEDYELFARFTLHGYRLTVVPEALFWYRVTPNSMVRSTSQRANFARSLRPHFELVPELYHPLIEMCVAKSLMSPGTLANHQHQPPLRYQIVDALNTQLKRMGMMHRFFKRSVKMVVHAGRTQVQATRPVRLQEEGAMKRNRQIDPGATVIRCDPFSTPRPLAPKKVGVANVHFRAVAAPALRTGP